MSEATVYSIVGVSNLVASTVTSVGTSILTSSVTSVERSLLTSSVTSVETSLLTSSVTSEAAADSDSVS